MVNQYPEERPKELVIDSFKFQLGAMTQVQKDNQLAVEALETRMRNIMEKLGTVKDVPVLQYIVNMTHDKTELKNLAKGLDRVADIIGDLDQAKAKQDVLDLAERDPLWFYWAFGGFRSEIDEIESTLSITPPTDVVTSEE